MKKNANGREFTLEIALETVEIDYHHENRARRHVWLKSNTGKYITMNSAWMGDTQSVAVIVFEFKLFVIIEDHKIDSQET